MKLLARFQLLFIIWYIIWSKSNAEFPLSNELKSQPSEEQSLQSLRVSSLHYEPFVYQENGKYKGIEYELIKTIAEEEHLNLSIHFEKGLSHLAFEHPVNYDIRIGGLFPNQTNSASYMVSNPYYYQDDFTWCIQKSKFFPMIINIFLAATPECWLLLIFGIGYSTGMVLYIMIQFDLKYEKRNQRDWHYTTWLIALPTVIGLSQRFYPKYGPLRIFYGFMLIMMIFVWQIVLYFGVRFIKVPVQRPQVSTTDEIINWEYRLTGSSEVFHLISFDERYKISQIDSFFVCKSIDRCLNDLKHDDNDYLAVGGSRQRILNSRSYSPSKIFCFDRYQNIASYQSALLIRKGFALKRRINKIIRNAFEGGLFVKWDRESQRKKERIIPFIPPLQISLREYAVAFVCVIGVGSLMSISALFCEIHINRKIKQNAPSHIWMYLEQFFDGKRHYLKNLTDKLQKKKVKRTKKIGCLRKIPKRGKNRCVL